MNNQIQMSYRRTKELIGTAQQNPNATLKQKTVQPEDNWNLIANPNVYLDELP